MGLFFHNYCSVTNVPVGLRVEPESSEVELQVSPDAAGELGGAGSGVPGAANPFLLCVSKN